MMSRKGKASRATAVLVVALVAISVMTMVVSADDPSTWPPSSMTWVTGPWSVNYGANVTFHVILASYGGGTMGYCDVTFSISGIGDVETIETGHIEGVDKGVATFIYDTGLLPLAADTYTVTASFDGIDAGDWGKHGPSSADQTLTILCTLATWYEDSDDDGYGNPAVSQVACAKPAGYVADNTDCDDSDGDVYPGATELIDGKDNDCDGMTDEVTTTVRVNSAGSGGIPNVKVYIRTPSGAATWNVVSGAVTNALGEYVVDLIAGTEYDFHVVYKGTCATQKLTVPVSGDVVEFNGVLTTVEAKDSGGNSLDGVAVHYKTTYPGYTSWQYIGATSGGQVTLETLPYAMTVRAVYHETTETTSASAGDTVEFETHKTIVKVLDCSESGINGANVYYWTGYCNHTGWNYIGATGAGGWSSGEVEIEFLQGSPDKADFHTPDLPAGLSSSSVRSKVDLSESSPVVTFGDDIDPVITCPGELTPQCVAPAAYADLNAFKAAGGTASDNCGIDADSFKLKSEVSDGSSCPEEITRTYEIADLTGNTAICTQTITVDDTTPPNITTDASDQTVECDGAGNAAELAAWLAANGGAVVAADACGDITWSNDFTALSDDCGATGSALVTFTATDECLNTDTTSATFTIQDNTPPAFTGCPSDITHDNDRGVCGAVVTWIEPTVGDVCGSAAFVSTHSPADFFPVGTTTVTYTATDDCGNQSTCVFDVTVLDGEPPTPVFLMTPPDPDYDLIGDFLWTATDNNDCTAPPNLLYRWKLDTGDWTEWLSDTTTGVGPLAAEVHTLTLEAKDETGNVSLPISYTWERAVYGVEPPSVPEPEGGGGAVVEGVAGASCFFDYLHCLEGAGGEVLGPEISAIYEVGEAITLNLVVTNDAGLPVLDAIASATFAEITVVDGEEQYSIVAYLAIPHQGGGLYAVTLLTQGTDPGVVELPAGDYLVWIGLNDGTKLEVRFQIIPPAG